MDFFAMLKRAPIGKKEILSFLCIFGGYSKSHFNKYPSLLISLVIKIEFKKITLVFFIDFDFKKFPVGKYCDKLTPYRLSLCQYCFDLLSLSFT